MSCSAAEMEEQRRRVVELCGMPQDSLGVEPLTGVRTRHLRERHDNIPVLRQEERIEWRQEVDLDTRICLQSSRSTNRIKGHCLVWCNMLLHMNHYFNAS